MGINISFKVYLKTINLSQLICALVPKVLRNPTTAMRSVPHPDTTSPPTYLIIFQHYATRHLTFSLKNRILSFEGQLLRAILYLSLQIISITGKNICSVIV